MPSFEVAYAAAAMSCATVAAIWDVKSRRIPNMLTVPCFLGGLLLHYCAQGWAGLGSAAAAGAIAFVLFLLFFLAGGMGGGDVKLMAAIGSLVGLHLVANVMVATALVGGVLAVAAAMSRGQVGSMLRNVAVIAGHHVEHGLTPHPSLHVRNAATVRLPYGVAIAAGVLLGCWHVWA